MRTHQTDYHRWRASPDRSATAMRDARERNIGLSLTGDQGIDLWL
jgi:hypothetical protein